MAALVEKRRLGALAAIAAFCFVVHGGNHIRRGDPHNVLWLCNVAPLLLAVGCAFGWPMPVAVAALWLALGTPLWLLDVAMGNGLILTTFLPHVVCPTVALLALRALGVPRHASVYATLGMLLLALVTRWSTPPAANVNMTFAVWKGFEAIFPRYEVYFATVTAGSTLVFLAVERLLAQRFGR